MTESRNLLGQKTEEMTGRTESGKLVKGRVVYSRGPIIRWLEAWSLISAVLALIALGLTIYLVLTKVEVIQTSRQRSAYDTCRLFRVALTSPAQTRGLTYRVADARGRIIGSLVLPKRVQSKAAGERFLTDLGLANCQTYAVRVRRGLPVGPVAHP